MKKFAMFAAAAVLSAGALAQSMGGLMAMERQGHVNQVNALNTEATLYVLDHKLASAAAFATMGGLAALLGKMDPDTQNALLLAGTIGVIYCLNSRDNFDECADAATHLTNLAVKVKVHQDAIARIDAFAR